MFKLCNRYCRYLLEDFMEAGGCGGVSDFTKVQWEDLWRSTGCFKLKKNDSFLRKVLHCIINKVYSWGLLCLCAGNNEPPEKACVGHYGLQLVRGPREPTARGPLVPSCSRTSCAWAPCASFEIPFDFMKNPDIGDVMNKFEVLGIVGEGKRFTAVQAGLSFSWGSPVAVVLLGFQRAAVWVYLICP